MYRRGHLVDVLTASTLRTNCTEFYFSIGDPNLVRNDQGDDEYLFLVLMHITTADGRER